MQPRPLAFVLAATRHGTMIVNRFDTAQSAGGAAFGVGHQLLSTAGFDADEVAFVLHVLRRRREHFGDGVVAVDAGANIGVHTVEWAKQMHGWGEVSAYEAQEVLFYALAGNIALNNCMNARARCAALGETSGEIAVPRPDYTRPASFGSLELRPRSDTEAIGQEISYDPADCAPVPLVALDSLGLARVDFIKIDVEGMEAAVLRGAAETIARHRPSMWIEFIKSDRQELRRLLEEWGYRLFAGGINWLAVHASDPLLVEMELAGVQVER
jgi:FkbM family methyltransferase